MHTTNAFFLSEVQRQPTSLVPIQITVGTSSKRPEYCRRVSRVSSQGARLTYFLLDGSNDAMQLAYEIMQHKTTM